MDGGSVRIPGWATVMGAGSSVQKRNAAHSAARLLRDRCGVLAASSRLSSPKHRASPRRLLDRPESTTPEAGARPPESIRSGYGGNVPEDVTIFFIWRARGARPRGVKNRDPRRGVS